MFGRWIASLKRESVSAEESTYRIHVAPRIGHKAPADLRRSDIVGVLDAAQAAGLTRTCGIILRDLRAACRYGLIRDWIIRDPTLDLQQADWHGKGKMGTRVLAQRELETLEARMVAGGLSSGWRACVWLILSTGNRQGETLHSRWEYVYDGVLHLPAKLTKNRQAHPVHLSPFAQQQLEIIKRDLGGAEWIFPHGISPGKPVYSKTLTTLLSNRQLTPEHEKWSTMAPAVRQSLLKIDTAADTPATLESWSPHDLRRTAATLMRQLGVPPDIVEACLNHTETNMLQAIYQRYEPTAEMRDAWAKLGAHLATLETPK